MTNQPLLTKTIVIDVNKVAYSSSNDIHKLDNQLDYVKHYFSLPQSIKEEATKPESRKPELDSEEGLQETLKPESIAQGIFTEGKIPDRVRSIPFKKLKKETKLDEINLLKSISQGDPTAFWQLWLLNQDYLYGRCLTWMGGDRTNAEEALSLARIKAWEKLPHHAEKITNPKAWLTRMTHNLCVDLHRKHHKSAIGMESIEEIAVGENQTLASSEYSPESAILRRELRMYISREIKALSPQLREAFMLRFYQDIPYPDIAKKLDLSVDNVYKRIQQARAILQKHLKRYISGIDNSPPLLKEVEKDDIWDNFTKKKSVMSSQTTTTPESNFDKINTQINYEVTAICLETLTPVW